jgi:hypothetical protein
LEVRVKGFRQVLISLLALAFVLAAAGVDAQQVDPKPYGAMPCQPNAYYFEDEKPQGLCGLRLALQVLPDRYEVARLEGFEPPTLSSGG